MSEALLHGGREVDTLLARGTRFEGKLVFEGVVRVDGQFAGEICTDDTLVVGEGAELEAQIDAGVVIVRGGLVRGAIRASESVEVYAPARVYGDITAPEVFIEKGVFFEGQCRMGEAARAALERGEGERAGALDEGASPAPLPLEGPGQS